MNMLVHKVILQPWCSTVRLNPRNGIVGTKRMCAAVLIDIAKLPSREAVPISLLVAVQEQARRRHLQQHSHHHSFALS